MRLEDIGFYTLSDERAKTVALNTIHSNLQRCELILTDRCNLRCLYCRGLKGDQKGDIPFEKAAYTVDTWIKQGLKNIRFSGGEPTLYKGLGALVHRCKTMGVERIALSTNGTAPLDLYHHLIKLGVNDISISLDSGCCSIGDRLAGGIKNSWDKAQKSILELSKITYVTVGMVFTEANFDHAKEAVLYAESLGPADIRIIPSAQYNKALVSLSLLPDDKLNKYPILKYRIDNLKKGKHVRGITEKDSHKCHLALDDMAVVGENHYPCIIYLREHGGCIGKVNEDIRKDRLGWWEQHDTHKDPICKNNCLDVCVDYNNKVESFRTVTLT